MMGGIIESKLFFRIHFSAQLWVRGKYTIKVLYSLNQHLQIWFGLNIFALWNENSTCSLGRTIYYECVHIYLDEIKVQTQNKYVLIVHIWSMLQSSREWGMERIQMRPDVLLCIQTKKGEKCILGLTTLTNMNFYSKDCGRILFFNEKIVSYL